jgi:hypothetical protein
MCLKIGMNSELDASDLRYDLMRNATRFLTPHHGTAVIAFKPAGDMQAKYLKEHWNSIV